MKNSPDTQKRKTVDRCRPDLAILALVLNVGGAERHMLRIAGAAKKAGRKVVVLTLVPGGELELVLEEQGIERVAIGKAGPFGFIKALVRLVCFVMTRRPKIIYSVLSLPNLAAGVLKLVARRTRVFWGIRSAALARPSFQPKEWLVEVLEKAFSPIPDGIIYNSTKGLGHFSSTGFSNKHSVVVRNGVDTSKFVFNLDSRKEIRGDLGIPEHALVIGTIGRAEFNKGPDIFLGVCEDILCRYTDIWVLVVGRNWEAFLEKARTESEGLSDCNFCIVSEALEVEGYYSAMDIFLSASRNEGTQNALLEAMSCERVCVVTDVGDARHVLGNPSLVCVDGDQKHLSACVSRVVSMSRDERNRTGKAARDRVVESFSLDYEYQMLSEIFYGGDTIETETSSRLS